MDPVVLDHSRYPQVHGELFRQVQERGLFEDDKTFVDARPRVRPDLIFERYLDRRNDPSFDLERFVDDHFAIPGQMDYGGVRPRSMDEYIEEIWDELTREFAVDPPHDGTLLPLPNEHVVPGDRFREMYYWDSYFVAEGLAATGRLGSVESIVENVASLVDRFDFVPLGNRVYYDSRSQFPLFYRMVHVLEREAGFDAIEGYLPLLETEYGFWMDGSADVEGQSGATGDRVVGLADGVANRYWDGRKRPRPEAYRHDRALAESVPVDDRPDLFRNLRAACESGWDFTSRWLDDPDDMTTIRTTSILPVDLNAALYEMEESLAGWLSRTGETETAAAYREAAADRRDLIERHFWDDERGYYVDYDWERGSRSDELTLAGAVPLFAGLAAPERADRVASRLEEDFLENGGLLTTLTASDQQWDLPNGWAPLQWMAIVGLHRYGHDDLAADVTDRWLSSVETVFEQTGTIKEKYDVRMGGTGVTDGEYPQQYGFGWTNGVAVALDSLDPGDVRPVDPVGR